MDTVGTRTRYKVTDFWGKVPEGIAVASRVFEYAFEDLTNSVSAFFGGEEEEG